MSAVAEISVPKLRFPEFKKFWFRKALGEYYVFKNGVNAEKSAYGKGRKFINVLDIIADGPINYDKIIGSVEVSENEFEKNKVVYGDILFQRSSETREEVGQSNVYLDPDKPATFGGFVIRGHPTREIDPEFSHYLLMTESVRRDMTSRSGGSTRYNVGQESLSEVKIRIPPSLDEQQKIASFLSAAGKKIAQLARKKTLLEDYKQGCMQLLFSQKLRFKDDQGNDFPDWVEEKLGDTARVDMGQSPPSYSYNDEGIGTPLIQGNADISGRKTTPRRFTSEPTKLCEESDILISVRAPIGEISRATIAACLGRGMGLIRPTIGSANYWYQFLIHIEPMWHNIGQGSTFSAINGADIRGLTVVVPSPAEQQKIADFLSSIDARIDLVTNELAQARFFKKGLLQKMFV